jgi:hypothetical protein
VILGTPRTPAPTSRARRARRLRPRARDPLKTVPSPTQQCRRREQMDGKRSAAHPQYTVRRGEPLSLTSPPQHIHTYLNSRCALALNSDLKPELAFCCKLLCLRLLIRKQPQDYVEIHRIQASRHQHSYMTHLDVRCTYFCFKIMLLHAHVMKEKKT